MKAFRHLAIIGCVLGLALIGTGIWLTVAGQPEGAELHTLNKQQTVVQIGGEDYLALSYRGSVTVRGERVTGYSVRFSLGRNGSLVWTYDYDTALGQIDFQWNVPLSELPTHPEELDFICDVLRYDETESSLPTLGIVLILGGFVVIFVGIGLARHLAEKAEAAGEDHPA